MKLLNILLLPVFLLSLSHCNPFSLDRDRGGRDGASGESRYRPFDHEPLDYSELRSKARTEYSNCTEYKNGDEFSIIPSEWSPTRMAKRCINFAIDMGLKPLCEEEKKLREAYKHYERQRDDEILYEIEEMLLVNAEEQYNLAEEIFILGDSADDICNVLHEGIDDMSDDLDRSNFWNELGGDLAHNLLRAGTNTEFCSFRNTFDRKARRPCLLIDLDNIGKERR